MIENADEKIEALIVVIDKYREQQNLTPQLVLLIRLVEDIKSDYEAELNNDNCPRCGY